MLRSGHVTQSIGQQLRTKKAQEQKEKPGEPGL
jgi:hypothetical protein